MAGFAGGAVLGGLLLGPFGAVFGAQLGAEFGGRQSGRGGPSPEELGLDKDMVLLAQRIASELSSAVQDRERVQSVRDDARARAGQLDAEVVAKYEAAMEAVKAEHEALARTLLADKLRLQEKLDKAKLEWLKADQRCSTMDRSVSELERRALEMADLLERAKAASGRQRTDLAAEASALGVRPPRDPLLDRFEALERGGK